MYPVALEWIIDDDAVRTIDGRFAITKMAGHFWLTDLASNFPPCAPTEHRSLRQAQQAAERER